MNLWIIECKGINRYVYIRIKEMSLGNNYFHCEQIIPI